MLRNIAQASPVLGISHTIVVPAATYSPWATDAGFGTAYSRIRDHTLVDIYRCWELWDLVGKLSAVDGDILEVGVWRGGTGALLAQACVGKLPPRTVYLADTFEGVVKAGPRDTSYTGGEHADTSEAIVRQLLRGIAIENVVILKGTFPESTSHLMTNRPLALVHIDVDTHDSARDIFAWALDRLTVGGAIVFDDYGFRGCEGITRLVNELKDVDDFLMIHNLNGHAIFIKRA